MEGELVDIKNELSKMRNEKDYLSPGIQMVLNLIGLGAVAPLIDNYSKSMWSKRLIDEINRLVDFIQKSQNEYSHSMEYVLLAVQGIEASLKEGDTSKVKWLIDAVIGAGKKESTYHDINDLIVKSIVSLSKGELAFLLAFYDSGLMANDGSDSYHEVSSIIAAYQRLLPEVNEHDINLYIQGLRAKGIVETPIDAGSLGMDRSGVYILQVKVSDIGIEISRYIKEYSEREDS
jgi:hypothetical protein